MKSFNMQYVFLNSYYIFFL